MKVFQCSCGNALFFGNTVCLRCQNTIGFCQSCQHLTAFLPVSEGLFQCGNQACGVIQQKCHNDAVEHICNSGVPSPDGTVHEGALCDDCRLTEVIPNLSIDGNRQLWGRLENAKRRVLYTLRLLNLPIGLPENTLEPKLVFDFAADEETPVFTGHDQGRITINLREADHVEREKARVAFQEPQRTLVGHVRHELGHYYWDLLVLGQDEEAFRAVFGDERSPTYQEALEHYYENGPRPNWVGQFVSAYSTMHPWEDFAECFGTYLDLVSVVETANHHTGAEIRNRPISDLLAEYLEIGGKANELNREMGLGDLVPEVFSPAVATKLDYVHQLLGRATNQTQANCHQTPAAPPGGSPAPAEVIGADS